jgi:hypothetical protein
MAKLNYFGDTGKFSITHISKEELKELISLLEKSTNDKMQIFFLDLTDDVELMDINSKDKKVPF